jgi:hypothetical protein
MSRVSTTRTPALGGRFRTAGFRTRNPPNRNMRASALGRHPPGERAPRPRIVLRLKAANTHREGQNIQQCARRTSFIHIVIWVYMRTIGYIHKYT